MQAGHLFLSLSSHKYPHTIAIHTYEITVPRYPYSWASHTHCHYYGRGRAGMVLPQWAWPSSKRQHSRGLLGKKEDANPPTRDAEQETVQHLLPTSGKEVGPPSWNYLQTGWFINSFEWVWRKRWKSERKRKWGGITDCNVTIFGCATSKEKKSKPVAKSCRMSRGTDHYYLWIVLSKLTISKSKFL